MPLISEEVYAEVQLDGDTIPASRIDIQISVGDHPKAGVKLHDGVDMTEISQAVGTVDTMRVMSRTQESMFVGRQDTNCSIFVRTSGLDSKELAFDGYSVSPSFAAAVGDYSYDYAVVHASSKLSAFSPGAYNPYKAHRLDSLVDAVYKKGATANLKTLLTTAINEMAALSTPPEKGALLDRIYNRNLVELNATTKPVWDQILENTRDDIWPEFSKLSGGPSGPNTLADAATLIAWVISVYGQDTAGFESVMAAIEAGFQVMYIPSLSGDFGRLVPYSDLVSPSGDLSLSVRSVNIVTGSRDFMPTSMVAVKAPIVNLYKQGDTKDLKSNYVAVWPETETPIGRIRTIPAPGWLAVPTFGRVKENVGGYINSKSYKEKLKASKEYVLDLGTPDAAIPAILRKFAKNAYVAMALGFSRTTITIPLTLDIELGKCYNVKLLSETGDGSFVGFLESVTHSISTSLNQGEATTVLKFSHVQAGSFRLPNSQ